MSDDEVTFKLAPPKPEFRDLSEKEVMAALKKAAPKKQLLASEVMRSPQSPLPAHQQ
jgi:hypothetical protein